MATDGPQQSGPAPHDEATTETPRPVEFGSSWSSPEFKRRSVALVTGPRSGLDAETQRMLRYRLKYASLLLLFTDAFYDGLIWMGFELVGVANGPVLWTYRMFLLAVLTVITVLLWSRVRLELRELRAVELLIFGMVGVMFVLMQSEMLAWAAAAPDKLPGQYAGLVCALMWLMLISVYAAFIPNTIRRSSVIIGVMALAPLVLVGIWSVARPNLWRSLSGGSGFPEMVGAMAVIYTTAVYGSYKIGVLRQEAFEARQLGQYRLKQRIGQGGMGEVFLAEHHLMKRPCAVKIIRPGRAADTKTLARFEREVRAAARLTHLNTIEIFDYGRAEDGTFFYAMEYLPGLSLQEIVERQGPLQPARAVHLMRQVCQALVEAHAKGLIHRDIKPSNIIAAERGGVRDIAKLLDFGLATSVEEQEDLRLTQEGVIAGSPYYLAPERILDSGEPDARGDIYSLGGVMYFLLTGEPPYTADKPIKVMIAHAKEELRPPRMINSEIPSDLERVVVRCLAKEPADRFPSVAELERALAECECADQWTPELAQQWWMSRHDHGRQVEGAAASEDTAGHSSATRQHPT